MHNKNRGRALPRVMIAAVSSGSGKTLITCGLLNLFRQDHMSVASYKCGPDYIDPMFHRRVIGVGADNLDAFFAEEQELRRIVGRTDADYALMEGVMGIYDGMSMESRLASSYDVAMKTDTPMILLVPAKGEGRTLLSVIRGILSEDDCGLIRGLILNQMSENAYLQMKPVLEEVLHEMGSKAAVLGFVPPMKEVQLESRHLGLKLPDEVAKLQEQLDQVSAQLRKSVDIPGLLRLMEAAKAMEWEEQCPEGSREIKEEQKLRLAVAEDEAFCFYYEENRRVMAECGIEWIPFSPIHDKKLPDNIQGLLLGGGYPELYAKELSENISILTDIREKLAAGLPYLAECGGFLYLHEALTDMEGTTYPLVGRIKAEAFYTGKLTRFGYVTLAEKEGWNGEAEQSDLQKQQDGTVGTLAKAVTGMRAHEFHYYDSRENGECCTAKKPSGTRSWACIHADDHSFAGFPHLYYRSNTRFVTAFAEAMKQIQ